MLTVILMSESLSLTFEKNGVNGVVWMKFPKEIQSKLIKSFQKFVLNPENIKQQVILMFFKNANLKSLYSNKEGALMGEEIGPNINALRFGFDLKESLNSLRLIANSKSMTGKQLAKSEMKEGFLDTSLTKKEFNNIQQRFKKIADGILKVNSKGKIQVDYIKVFSVMWYDFLRGNNLFTSIKKKLVKKQKRFGRSLPYEAKKIIKVSTITVLAIVLIVFGVSLLKPTPILVQKYDLVTLEYVMWESDYTHSYDPLNPLIDETLAVKVIPRTEQDDGLILGLYNNLIGKARYYKSGLIWLEKSVDQNRDGIDDNMGRAALSYGNYTDQYFSMNLMIQFKILDIQ